MSRTPEQVAADEALTEAIEAVERAYHGDVNQGVLTSYVVIAKRKYWDEDGDGVTAISSMPKDSDVSIDELLGLVEYAATRYRAEIAQ
ncbi:hypothetical protein [Nocardia farcinica]|uniref:hypothetical protein n=1 Tax=Nocardia farcinica TaxID=37329 RepID=UPI002453C05B|nr:hypothetical protein [Nocardia farcinica]